MPSISLNNNPGAIIIEGHVQGLSNARSLGEAGIPVYVVDKTNCIARYSKFCNRFFKCPDFVEDEFADFLVKLAISEKIKNWVLIPSNDHAVITISKHKSILEEYYKVVTPSFEKIDNIYDKSKLLRIAEENKIPIPVTYYVKTQNDALPEEVSFPVLLKGKYGLSFYKTFGKKVFLAENIKQFRSKLTYIASRYDIDKVLIQELIPSDNANRTISFTAFCHHGEIKAYWMGEKLREHPQRFGTATFARSLYIKECYDQSVPLLEALNYTGVCEIEYLLDPGGRQYKLIEVNARTWLWAGLAKTCGVDYARIIYDFVNDREIRYPSTYATDKYWINPITDTFYALTGILKGRITPSEYFGSFKNKSITNALFISGDMKPGFFYLVNLLNIFRRR